LLGPALPSIVTPVLTRTWLGGTVRVTRSSISHPMPRNPAVHDSHSACVLLAAHTLRFEQSYGHLRMIGDCSV
jgi:hypothetical protein